MRRTLLLRSQSSYGGAVWTVTPGLPLKRDQRDESLAGRPPLSRWRLPFYSFKKFPLRGLPWLASLVSRWRSPTSRWALKLAEALFLHPVKNLRTSRTHLKSE